MGVGMGKVGEAEVAFIIWGRGQCESACGDLSGGGAARGEGSCSFLSSSTAAASAAAFSFAASFVAAGCTAAEIMPGLRRLWRLPARQPRMRRAGVGASASAAAAARAVGCAPAALAAAAKIVLSKLSRPMLARPAASEASAAAAAGARAARGASAAVESMRDVGGAAHVTAAAPLIPCEAPAMSPSRYIVNPVSPPRVARKPTLYAPTSAAAASTARSWRRPLRLPTARLRSEQ